MSDCGLFRKTTYTYLSQDDSTIGTLRSKVSSCPILDNVSFQVLVRTVRAIGPNPAPPLLPYRLSINYCKVKSLRHACTNKRNGGLSGVLQILSTLCHLYLTNIYKGSLNGSLYFCRFFFLEDPTS